MKKYIIIPTTLVLGSIFVSCLTTKNGDSYSNRNPSSYEGENKCSPEKYSVEKEAYSYTKPGYNILENKCQYEVPPGLVANDLADFEHLSEGADVYPYEWFMNLKSVVFKDDKIFNENVKGKYNKYFHELLDKKFGVLKSNAVDSYKEVNGKKIKVKYLIPYAGITASWNNHSFDNSVIDQTGDVSNSSDAFAAYEDKNGNYVTEERIVKDIKGVKSIRMVGTNCALCHSGSIEFGGKLIPVQGSPSMVNVRGFFKDMAGATVVMLTDEDLLMNFLSDIKKSNPNQFSHINPEKDAKELSKEFTTKCSKATNSVKDVKGLGAINKFLVEKSPLGILRRGECKITLLFAKNGDNERLFKGIDAIKDGLVALLKKTYNLTDEDLAKTHLVQRMDYFAKLSVGIDPSTTETPSGFNRTDAFGRIGNLVLRGSHPVDITAPVSLPWVWGLKYMANLHYNGNSNSVIMRNVGQSLGLGAIILDKNLTSTVNVHNLDKIEHLVHKIKVPDWKEIFKDEAKVNSEVVINESLLPRGYQIYKSNCMYCHENNRFVGPSMVLREYKMFPLASADGKCNGMKDGVATQYECSPNTDRYAATNPIKPITDESDPVLKKLIPFQDSIFTGVGAIKEKYYKDHGISLAKQKEMEFYNLRGNEFFRDTYNGFDKQKDFKNNYGDMTKGMGYKARHLSGVWATGPFLHNGSVPTLWEMLKPAKDRPKYFNVKSMAFDPKYIGAPVKVWNRNNKKCDLKDKVDKEICFDTTMPGNSNVGHEWGAGLSEQDKLSLIEFLKYLPPEPEYSWNKETY
jgi:cytochrome c5